MGQTLTWLPFRLGQDVFDFWIVLDKTKLKVNHTGRNTDKSQRTGKIKNMAYRVHKQL